MARDDVQSLDPPGWGTRLVMLGGGLLAALAMMGITSVLPAIEADLARRPGDGLMVKQLVGIVSLAMMVGAPLAGFLVDRVGLRPLLVTSALVYAVAGTAGLYLDALPMLVLSRLFVGVAAAAIQIISITLINTRLDGQDRARWMGVHIAVAMIGTIVIHPVAGALGELSWRWPFGLYAIGLLMVPVALLERSPVAAMPAPAGSARAQRLLAWFPFRYALLALFIGGISYLPMVYIPFLLRQHGMESPSLIALVLTADSAVGAVMAMLYGRARRRLSTNGAFVFSFASAGLGTLVAALSPSIAGVVAGLMIFGFGVGWFIANLMTALASQVTKAQQGRAAGLVKAAHFLSAPICIALIEPIARVYGPASVMLIVSVTAFGLLIVMGWRMLRSGNRSADTVGQPAHG